IAWVSNLKLAESASETLRGLMNVTSCNAVELIIAIVTLTNGHSHVDQTFMLCSVFSNILLVLGSCFLAGWIAVLIDTVKDGNPKQLEQTYSSTAAQTSSSLITLSYITLVLPATFPLLLTQEILMIQYMVLYFVHLPSTYQISIHSVQ
ncbi:7264_t:CDS:2, partial [Gigaspora rosea]